MGEVVRVRLREAVALVAIDNPPVNAMDRAVRVGLVAALDAALADAAVSAIVIRAEGRGFSAGADLRDLFRPDAVPTLADLCQRIEDAPKPVLAAIHGNALGGGFELALACHYRLVHSGARLGLPGVALGLVPSAGGGQRLARIVGARIALDMLISGRPVGAEAAAQLGLADRVIEKNLDRAAFGSARNLARAEAGPRPTGARREGFADPAGYLQAIAERRAGIAGDRRDVVHRAVDIVEAALLLPFEAGRAMERAQFEALVASDQARALRDAFLAERRTLRHPALAGQAPRVVARVGVVGGGRLGAGILRACLAAGFAVTLVEKDAVSRSAARARIVAGITREAGLGRLDAAARADQIDRLAVADEIEALAAADLVIEALPEDLEARRAVFARAGAVTRPGTVLASAGLGPDLAALARASGRPADVIGLRFFLPAQRVRLLEVVCPPEAAPDLAATGVAFARALGKLAVLPGAGGGSLALPVFAALFGEASEALLGGAGLVETDTALRDYGFALGPFQLADLAGLDRLAALGWSGPGGALLGGMASAGLLGRAVGRGFYSYGAGGRADGPAPGLAAVVAGLRADPGPGGPRPAQTGIAERAALAMANAGARLVAEGVAHRPSDIDAAMLAGFAYPRWRGGPMRAADAAGLLNMRNRLRALDGSGAGLGPPSPLFDKLIKEGASFARLNAGAASGPPDGSGGVR